MSDNPAVDKLALRTGWRLVRDAPDATLNPSEVDWTDAIADVAVPGTAAAALATHADACADVGSYANTDHDDYDWWYQCEFPACSEDYQSIILQFDGLATIAAVWLNGESIHTSENMFRTFRLDVTSQVKPTNTLSIVFRSVSHYLKSRRPRPSWKTNLVSNQQLRWIRTTLLGRIPGWTPPIQAVGPWRGVSLECARSFSIESAHVHSIVLGNIGEVHVEVNLEALDPKMNVDSATIEIGDQAYPLSVERTNNSLLISVRIRIDEIEYWNPNGYGEPRLYEYAIAISCGDTKTQVKSGRLGFRSIELDREDGRVQFVLNNVELFARGACWTSNDIESLSGDAEKLRRILTLMQQAGGNMIRIGGTMVYEADMFYDTCDELGITVWQDFMFANMDYPSDDADFLQEVALEVDGQVKRLREHPCVIIYCGNSEVEQQAAMFGMTEDVWRDKLFYDLMPAAVEKLSPGTPYFPSSPSEGALPFHSSSGPSHYFGVGAYKQSFDDLTKSQVKFASECLAFSNFPGDESLREHFGTTAPAVHQPQWKTGVPRDSAAGWDFEDVRDHYIKRLYGLDPVELRYFDKEAYTALSQVVTGEVMETVYDHWRATGNQCSGGLIWFLNDIVPGAGWGIIDSDGRPKPAYYFLRRSWNSTTLSICDRGMDGLLARLSNDTDFESKQRLAVKLLQHSHICIAESYLDIEVAPNQSVDVMIDELLGRFLDTTHRYRFGPPKHDVVVMALVDENGEQTLTKCFYPGTRNLRKLESINIEIDCDVHDGMERISILSDSFLQHVKLGSRTHEFGENYFHLFPGIRKTISATKKAKSEKPLYGTLSAINLTSPRTFK